MTSATRLTWILAALAVSIGAGELAARGIAPHTQAMLGSDPGRAALRAGTIVARNLTDLAADFGLVPEATGRRLGRCRLRIDQRMSAAIIGRPRSS